MWTAGENSALDVDKDSLLIPLLVSDYNDKEN